MILGLFQKAPAAGSELLGLRKDMFLRMLSARKSTLHDEVGDHRAPQRATSLDSISRAPPKSILKKSTSNIQVDQPSVIDGKPGTEVGSEEDNVSVESGDITSAKDDKPANPRLRELAGNQFRSSAPDLRARALPPSEAGGTISKSSSTKSLSFNMEKVEIVPVHPKQVYNRKPDNDVTFKKLTPKLKAEIREELNTYKRNEMSVHASSEINTVFH